MAPLSDTGLHQFLERMNYSETMLVLPVAVVAMAAAEAAAVRTEEVVGEETIQTSPERAGDCSSASVV